MGKTFLLGFTLAFAVLPAFGQTSAVERGKYLVNNVVLCGDCHSPRLQNGEFDPARHLKGTALFFLPAQPIPNWAKYAPNITGGGIPWSERDLVTFLRTGRGPGGISLRPPMPPYRMSQQDAEAIAKYLKSLK